ncbi:uncharacterized protein [Haliotis asinina]|uniref:uncharacterized protein n=1 Tax=Haliotis asinina TaxID=109174 RepID=UPI003531ADD4
MRRGLTRIFSRVYHGQSLTINTLAGSGLPRRFLLQNPAKVRHHGGGRSFASAILQSPFQDEDIVATPLTEYLLHCFYSLGDLDALVDYDTKETFTFSQLSDAVVAVASSLTKRGYVKGDVIAVVTPSNVHISSLVLGVSAIGATVAMIDPTSTPEEISRQLQDCGAQCVVCSQPLVSVVKNFSHTRDIKDLFVLGDADGVTSFSTLLEDDGRMFRDDIVIDSDNDVMGLFYTGGTTGPPKSAMLTHSNIVSALHQIRVPVPVRTGLEKVLCATPSHHVYSLVMAHLGVLQDGGMVVGLRHPNPQHCLQAVDTYGITRLYTVPSTLKQFTTADRGYDLSCLESVYCGAAPLKRTVATAFTERFGIRVYQGYGMTETTGLTHVDTEPGDPTTAGVLLPNTLGKITDPYTGDILPTGDRGELCIKGPQVMKGYHGNRNATHDVVDKDGWFHTGDLARASVDGRIVVEGRLADVIMSQGHSVSPNEVEDVLETHSDVEDSAVIGVPDTQSGEVPKALVVKSNGSSVSQTDLQEFVAANLDTHKHLRGGVEFVDQIPRSPSGQINRRVLKKKAHL